MANTKQAIVAAEKLTAYAKDSKVQICNYGRRYAFAKGTEFVADGHCIRPFGRKDAFIVGTFKAYLA